MAKDSSKKMDHQKDTRKQAIMVIVAFAIVASLLLLIMNWQSYHTTSKMATLNQPNCDTYKGPLSLPPPIQSFTWQGTGLITLWFDDAWISQYTVAFPIMEKAGFKGAVAVAINFLCKIQFMTWDQVRILQNHGWETTAHTISHICDLHYYTTDTTKYELLGSKQALMAHGLRADNFVMPCGYSRDQIASFFVGQHPPIVETAEKYFASYRSTKSERINSLPVIDAYNLKAFQMRNTTTDQEIQDAINTAKAQKGWLILVFHQIDDSHRPLSIPTDKFQKILDMVKASGLPVVLPSQALAIKSN